ncbi:MAG: conserved rane protein of unknown function [Blastococcus sp.]|nr:conserved rane protein of unknown function [Blastococcus sp.]
MPIRGPVARALTGVGLLCGLVVALAGGIVLHGSPLVVLGMAAGFAGCVAYVVRDGTRATSIEAAWKAAAWTVAVIVLITGLVVLVGGTGAMLVSGVVVAGGAVWAVRATRARHGRAASRLHPVVDLSPAPVPLLPTSVLGSEWRRTTATLACRLEPATRQAITRRRQEILDELECRDPAGFARWLAAGSTADSDPAAFVQYDRTTGTDAA